MKEILKSIGAIILMVLFLVFPGILPPDENDNWL